MHTSSMLRMQWFRENYLDDRDSPEPIAVLDAGSQMVEQQKMSYRNLLPAPRYAYTGLDMEAGRNVDIVVENPYRWMQLPDNTYDAIISGQMLEHVEFPWLTLGEMARVVKPGGLICIIAPSMWPYHGAPIHCQNYFSDGLVALAKYAGLETLHASTNLAPQGASADWYDMKAQDSMLVARKPLEWKADAFDVDNYRLQIADSQKLATGMVHFRKQKRAVRWKVSLREIMLLPGDLKYRLLHPQK